MRKKRVPLDEQVIRIHLASPIEAVFVFIKPRWVNRLIRGMRIVIRTDTERLIFQRSRRPGDSKIKLEQVDPIKKSQLTERLATEEPK